MELLDGSWFLHTSLWTVPWHLFRHAVLKAVSFLRIRRVACKSARPPIPRIVLIRADGEVVPVNLEDHQLSANGDVCLSLEAENLEMGDDMNATSEGEEPRDAMQSLISPCESCIAMESEALPVETVSEKGRVAEAQDGTRLASFASDFAEDSHLLANQVPDKQLQISPVLGETANASLQSVEEEISDIPVTGLDALVVMQSDRDIDERTGGPEQMVEAVVDDIQQNGADSLDGQGDLDRDPITFSPWTLIDDPSLDETGTLSETLGATSSFVGSQTTPSPVKNVRFTIGDGAGPEDYREESLSLSRTDEYSCAWNLGSHLEDDGIAPVPIPAMPFDSSMVKQGVASPEQLTNDVVPAESPSLTGMPIVNLPSLVTIREDRRFVEMIPAALVEDITTRSPVQMPSPIVPTVVINVNYVVEVEERGLTPLAIEERDQSSPSVGYAFETLNDRGSVSSPIIVHESSRGAIQEIALSASATVSETGMPAASASVVVTNAGPGSAIVLAGTNERKLGVRVLYETPRCYADGENVALSLQKVPCFGPEIDIQDATSTRVHLPAVSKSPREPGMEDQVDFVPVEKSNSVAIALTSQSNGLSGVLATELPSLDTCEQASPLSMTSGKKVRELDHECREIDTILWNQSGSISKPPPERTLSGSIHASRTPPELPSLSLAGPKGKGGTSTIAEPTSKGRQDLSASIHAPQRVSRPDERSSARQSRDESDRDHRRSVTNPVVSEKKPCGPNWTAMPEVVAAFHKFKQAPSGSTIRRASSIAESLSRGPMLGVVGQKGVATNSRNNISVTANRWMHGNGLLLVRDVVPSDPADFNLRNWQVYMFFLLLGWS